MKKTVLGNVIHDEADLITMPGKHNPRFSGRIPDAKNIAHHIGANLIAPRPDSLADEFLNIVLVAGRARSFYQLFEEVFTVGFHDVSDLRSSLLKPGALTTETSGDRLNRTT